MKTAAAEKTVISPSRQLPSGDRNGLPRSRQRNTSGSSPQNHAAAAETVVPAGKFKATCLQLLDAAEQGESITITKRGRVVARLVPPEPEKAAVFFPLSGRMKGEGKVLGDIVSPDFQAWGMKGPRKE